MIFKTYNNDDSKINIKEINKYVEDGKNVFILIFMDGCGPCNATRPEWDKIKKVLENKYKNDDNIVIVDVNKNYSNYLKHIGDIDGFPSIKYISNKGKVIENYEDASISNKDRTVESFIEWIESKIKNNNNKQSGGSVWNVYRRIGNKYNKTNKKKSNKKKSNKKKINKKKTNKTNKNKKTKKSNKNKSNKK
jgi:thiol-disulfide isomerase/thioredoxin